MGTLGAAKIDYRSPFKLSSKVFLSTFLQLLHPLPLANSCHLTSHLHPLNLRIILPPLLAVLGYVTDCHGTYMYQCMQTKVDAALGYLTTDTRMGPLVWWMGPLASWTGPLFS